MNACRRRIMRTTSIICTASSASEVLSAKRCAVQFSQLFGLSMTARITRDGPPEFCTETRPGALKEVRAAFHATFRMNISQHEKSHTSNSLRQNPTVGRMRVCPGLSEGTSIVRSVINSHRANRVMGSILQHRKLGGCKPRYVNIAKKLYGDFLV